MELEINYQNKIQLVIVKNTFVKLTSQFNNKFKLFYIALN